MRRDYESATDTLRKIVDDEPTREEAHTNLMCLHALSGRKGEALAQYGRLEEVLLRELGTDPSASSRALRQEIATQRFPPEQIGKRETLLEGAADVSRHNLPAPRPSFVGRQREIVDVKRELAMTRLLTLTGVGGTGKTRLALEVARDLVDAYPDGVWQVELAPLSGSEQVPQAVARGLQPLSSLSSQSPSGLRLLTLFNRNFGGH